MGPTSLDGLRDATDVTALPDGLRLRVSPTWIIAGEDRLSSTTILRLIECCREYHWSVDVLAQPGCESADAICCHLESDFLSPIDAGEDITITYGVQSVGRRSYTVRFVVANRERRTCARCVMVLAFYDAEQRRSLVPAPFVTARLSTLTTLQEV
jgi:acyl-CoA thioesterase FadM